jgi:hypothetical protein
MNIKRFLFASISVFVFNQVSDAIIHGVLLGKIYGELRHVWRSDMTKYMWLIQLSSLVFGFLFVFIYSKGCESKGLIEGIRYGALIGLLMNGVVIANQYAVYPISISMAFHWFLYGMIQYLFYGVITALIYKPLTLYQGDKKLNKELEINNSSI